jgi:hypothetical protein
LEKKVKSIAAAIVATAMSGASGLANADMAAGRTNEPIPAAIHANHDGQGAQAAGVPHPMHGQRPDGPHRHKVVAVIVYVPTFGPVSAPYYYAPGAPVYVDQDPPDGAYSEPSGFYYWCSDPSGYYPYQPDCPTGWRLVAP